MARRRSLVEGAKLVSAHGVIYIPEPSKLRKLAWAIKNHRDYLRFVDEAPRYLFGERGGLPRRYWRDKVWMTRYIVEPTIRKRMRWPSEKLTGDAMPTSLRRDNRLF